MTPHRIEWAGECARGTEAPNTSWEGYRGPTGDESGTGVAGLGGTRPWRL